VKGPAAWKARRYRLRAEGLCIDCGKLRATRGLRCEQDAASQAWRAKLARCGIPAMLALIACAAPPAQVAPTAPPCHPQRVTIASPPCTWVQTGPDSAVCVPEDSHGHR
jgi:hypothetical protein